MKLISKKLHDQLVRAAERVKPKYQDRLLTAKASVSVPLLLELGVAVSPEAKAKWEEVKSRPAQRGVSEDVATNVLWSDYYKALKAYAPESPKEEKQAAK